MLPKILIVVALSVGTIMAMFFLGKVADGNGDGDSTQKENKDGHQGMDAEKK